MCIRDRSSACSSAVRRQRLAGETRNARARLRVHRAKRAESPPSAPVAALGERVSASTAGAGSGDSAEGDEATPRRVHGAWHGEGGRVVRVITQGASIAAHSYPPRSRRRTAPAAATARRRVIGTIAPATMNATLARTPKKCTKDEVPKRRFRATFHFYQTASALIYVQFSDVKPRAASVFAIARSRSPHSSAQALDTSSHRPDTMATEQQKGTFAVKVGLAQVRRSSRARDAFHRRAPAESPPATIARFGKAAVGDASPPGRRARRRATTRTLGVRIAAQTLQEAANEVFASCEARGQRRARL